MNTTGEDSTSDKTIPTPKIEKTLGEDGRPTTMSSCVHNQRSNRVPRESWKRHYPEKERDRNRYTDLETFRSRENRLLLGREKNLVGLVVISINSARVMLPFHTTVAKFIIKGALFM